MWTIQKLANGVKYEKRKQAILSRVVRGILCERIVKAIDKEKVDSIQIQENPENGDSISEVEGVPSPAIEKVTSPMSKQKENSSLTFEESRIDRIPTSQVQSVIKQKQDNINKEKPVSCINQETVDGVKIGENKMNADIEECEQINDDKVTRN